MDLYEYQGKQYFARFGIPTSAGRRRRHGGRGGGAGRRRRLPGGGEGPGEGGRPRQGRRDQAGRPTPTRHAGTPRPSWGWTSRATPCTACGSSTPRTSPRSTTPASPWTGRPSSTWACSRPRAGWRSRRWRPPTPTPSPGSTSTRSTGSTRPPPAAGSTRPTSTRRPASRRPRCWSSSTSCYVEGDCDLAEINPLILTADGRVHALDAKVTLDENATYRHPEWAEYAAAGTEDPREVMAKEQGPQLHRPVGYRWASSPTAPGWP